MAPPVFFGAGYGNRTRLHGLGSRCITDIRTLRCEVGCIIADAFRKIKGNLSPTGIRRVQPPDEPMISEWDPLRNDGDPVRKS